MNMTELLVVVVVVAAAVACDRLRCIVVELRLIRDQLGRIDRIEANIGAIAANVDRADDALTADNWGVTLDRVEALLHSIDGSLSDTISVRIDHDD